MKKFVKGLAFVLAGTMLLGMVGCGSASNSSATEDTTDTVAQSSSDSTDVKTVSAGKFTWATNAEFEPYEYREGDKVVGIDAELADAIAEKLGLEAEVEDMAFDSIIPAVTSGKADVGLAGMTASEDRKVSVDFSDTYVEAGQVIIVKKGSDIKDASGLSGKTVGVQLGTTGDLYVSDPQNVENVTVQQFPKGADAVEALKTDKIDAVVIDNQPAKKFVENNSDIEILATPLTQESYAIAVAKDNKQLLDAVNKALAELKESGELDSILNKYLASDESAETTTSAQ